jgi:hypothetical protein
MINLIPLVALNLTSLAMQVGGMDMAVAEKWSSAKVVRYHVEGVHNGRESVVFGDYEGKADVIDRLTVEFTWDVSKAKILGPVTVKDGKSVLTNIKSDGTNCPPPQLKGDYEHFQSESNSIIADDQIQITGKRAYPAANVSNYPGGCSMRPIPAGSEQSLVWVASSAPEVLGMPNMPGSPVAIAANRKSFTIKGAGNWVWTYTPTLVQ